MSRDLRIGLCTLPHDSFWLQAGEAIYRRGQGLPIELVSIPADDRFQALSGDELAQSADQLLALERKAFMDLLRRSETLARMEHMLETGRPLRN